MIKDNAVEYKSYSFASRIIKAYKYLSEQKESVYYPSSYYAAAQQ